MLMIKHGLIHSALYKGYKKESNQPPHGNRAFAAVFYSSLPAEHHYADYHDAIILVITFSTCSALFLVTSDTQI